MTAIKTKLRKYSFDYHRIVAQLGGVAILFFALSGGLHVLMTWTGPKAKAFFPPSAVINAHVTDKIPGILKQHKIENPLLVKVIPSKAAPVLQITTEEKKPRTYYSLETGDKIPDGDLKQARFLAAYYSGLPDEKIKNIAFQTEFDGAYPWVNRLIPVYKVTYDTPDDYTLYVHTEINALAGVTNNYKTAIQKIFRTFHTFSFLDPAGAGRVLIVSLFLFSIFGLCVTGFFMIFTVKKRKILDKKRYYHRLFANIVWLPLFFFVASGFWHLLHYEFADNLRGLRITPPMNLVSADLAAKPLSEDLSDIQTNALALMTYEDRFYYRLSPAVTKRPGAITRNSRFDGIKTEKDGIYIDVQTGERADLTDVAVTTAYAEKALSARALSNSLVSHFGPHYDFRNKRLPVREILLDTPDGSRLFIDPATGILVDRLADKARYEGYSFSFLHKWNFLSIFIGREKRDALLFVFLTLVTGLTLLGYVMLLTRKRRKTDDRR